MGLAPGRNRFLTLRLNELKRMRSKPDKSYKIVVVRYFVDWFRKSYYIIGNSEQIWFT